MPPSGGYMKLQGMTFKKKIKKRCGHYAKNKSIKISL